MYQKVVMIGNLTRDIELRYLPSGAAVAKSAIATSYKYKSSAGEQKEEVCYLDFNIFGKSAETANQYLKKGSKVLLEGRLVLEQWTAQDGSNRSKHSLRVDTMKMLDGKKDNESNHQQEEHKEAPITYDGQPYIPEINIDEDEIPFSEVTAPIHNAETFYYKCVSCGNIFSNLDDLECDGDIYGTCPVCKTNRVFHECDKLNGLMV